MKHVVRIVVAIALAGMIGWAGCGPGGGKKLVRPAPPAVPQIDRIAPDSAEVGDGVVITGSDFGATRGSSQVRFGAVEATPTFWADGRVDVLVPTGAATGTVGMVVGGQSSNTKPFKVLPTTPPPVIAAVHPDSAAVGDTVSVVGHHFGAGGPASVVDFGTLSAATPSWSDSLIRAIVPPGAVTGDVLVMVGRKTSNSFPFTALPPRPTAPEIASIVPDTAAVGQSVHITGLRFGATKGTSTVLFNSVIAETTTWGDAAIDATVPAGAANGFVAVTVNGQTSNSYPFTLLALSPSITRLLPARTVVGDTVIVQGTNFGAQQGQGGVSFAGAGQTRLGAVTIAWADAQISALVPAGAADGPVQVTVGQGNNSNGVAFSVATHLVSFTNDLYPDIFGSQTFFCVGCHGGQTPQNNLSLESAVKLMRGDSFHGPVVIRRNGPESIIVQKVSQNPPFGARMPFGGPNYLSDAQQLEISDWIDQGARNN